MLSHSHRLSYTLQLNLCILLSAKQPHGLTLSPPRSPLPPSASASASASSAIWGLLYFCFFFLFANRPSAVLSITGFCLCFFYLSRDSRGFCFFYLSRDLPLLLLPPSAALASAMMLPPSATDASAVLLPLLPLRRPCSVSPCRSSIFGKFACFSFKVEKLAPFLKVAFDGSSEIPNMLQCSKYKEDMHQRFPSLTFLASNVLMFSTPPKVLAETCQADNSVFNMPVLLAVALIGATVGGLLARQRRGELQRVNDQLLQINAALRKQAKIESYAPSLSYAPIGGRIPENEVIVDTKKQELISKLKNGKNYLRNQQPDKAFMEFKIALELAQNLKDPIEEKKAARGLGASLQRQGKYREAIKYHSMVLAISDREGEDSGNTEAFGAIADCYTELGDLERAGQFYDKYIARLEKD